MKLAESRIGIKYLSAGGFTGWRLIGDTPAEEVKKEGPKEEEHEEEEKDIFPKLEDVIVMKATLQEIMNEKRLYLNSKVGQ